MTVSDANKQEAEYWSGAQGRTWISQQKTQDRLFSEALDVVLDRAALKPGGKTIDIGCGTGALSLAAASRVGRPGHVIATDFSRPMLDRAAERTAHLPQVSTLHADAQTVVWPGTGFDAAISRFGVMFFSDPASAFANIARALRSGGRMTFATWAPVEVNPYWRDPARIAATQLGHPPKSPPRAPGPMGMSDKEWSLEQLAAAGLEEPACEEVDIHLTVEGTPEDAADLCFLVGPAARIVRLFEATEKDLAVIRADLVRYFEDMAMDNTVHIPARLNVYTATVA